jgi:site-specific DNA-methyltransferase (cytosine-N4-specific)
MTRAAQRRKCGAYFVGDAEELLGGDLGPSLQGNVQLLLTSPPFPLNNKKSYGNRTGKAYLEWFVGLAEVFSNLLTPDGSIVIELGNAWSQGRPVQSLLPMECLIGFVKNRRAGLRVCQQFICHNPARLPSPAEWVTIRRIRAADSYTHVWWMAKSDFPKADNRRVLRPYGRSMRRLLDRKSYNSGKRPSEHSIGPGSFLANHGGSIQPSFIDLSRDGERLAERLPNVMKLANTNSNDYFHRRCREEGITPHPARMHPSLAAYFIEFLTEPGDLVLDPFAGSNTTGYIAEMLGRRWISIDISKTYVRQSRIRFEDPGLLGSPKTRSRR